MPELDDQLRAVARRIDADSTPVDLDELLSAGPAFVFDGRQRRLRRAVASAAVAVLVATAGIAGVLISRHRDRAPQIRISVPTTGASAPSTTPRREPCVFRHAPGDLYSLAQPASITLPGGKAIPIVPGNPITQSGAVTLDSDGSTYPGQAGPAASLLWGAANPGGPFAPLAHAAIGDIVTLRQSRDTGAAGVTECVQHWRIVRVFEPPVTTWSEPTLLRLVGFTPHGSLGPTVQFYVDAVPA